VNIAVTGGLGTGKSTVSKLFAFHLGSENINTDQLCREQLEPGEQGFAEFIEVFGRGYLSSDGSLNRPLLRQAVFADFQVKEGLENILHPIVQQEVATRCANAALLAKHLVVEVPLLFEVGWQDEFDTNVVVYVSEEVCFERVMERDGLSVAEIQQVLKTQLPIEQKLRKAHFVVDNSGTFVSTIHQVSWVARIINK